MLDMLKIPGFALAGAVLLGVVACSDQSPPSTPEAAPNTGEDSNVAKIEGEVFYRERIKLPPGAELEVQLEDISRADAMATVIATVNYKLALGPPFPFAIEYDPARIDESMRYALRARITAGGQLRFTNTEYIDPFAGNPVKVLVHSIARPQAPASTVPESEEIDGLEGDESDTAVWILQTLQGEQAPAGEGGAPVDLQLSVNDSSVAGFSGCNRYRGGFTDEGSSTRGTPIKFGPLASTMRACAEGGDLEQRYLQVLGTVDAYRMQGETLALLAGEEVVATFKAR